MPQGLTCHQKIVGANGLADRFERGAYGTSYAGIIVFKRKHQNWAGEESFEALAVEVLLFTFSYAVPEFKKRNGRDEDVRARGGRFLHTRANRGRIAVDQGDASIRIEQVIHWYLRG